MKIFCMHLKIILCVTAVLILLGIITVTPCAIGQKGSLLGRSYGIDCGRANELCSLLKGRICSDKE